MNVAAEAPTDPDTAEPRSLVHHFAVANKFDSSRRHHDFQEFDVRRNFSKVVGLNHIGGQQQRYSRVIPLYKYFTQDLLLDAVGRVGDQVQAAVRHTVRKKITSGCIDRMSQFTHTLGGMPRTNERFVDVQVLKLPVVKQVPDGVEWRLVLVKSLDLMFLH